jgi:hypothetical protein
VPSPICARGPDGRCETRHKCATAADPEPLQIRNPLQVRNRAVVGGFFGEVLLDQGLSMKAVLSVLGILFIIAWLVLWLAVKVTFGAIHLLVVIGVVLVIFALIKAV